jgi:hypothetical protein
MTHRAPSPAAIAALLTAARFVLSPFALQAQTGGFLSMLGKDTAFVERYVRRGNRIDGILVSHFAARPGTPSPVLTTYAITLNDDGSVATYEVAQGLSDGTPTPGAPTGLRMTFTGDSVIREGTLPNGQPIGSRSPAAKGTLSLLPYSQLLLQLGIQQARRERRESFDVYTFQPSQLKSLPVGVRFIGDDSVEVETLVVSSMGKYYNGYRIDHAGRITRGDGSKSTWRFAITSASDFDVVAIAKAWAAGGATGQKVGMMSPIDTLKASVGAGTIQIVYSRPGKRSRPIWGGVVPWGEVWRLGANAATMLTTDKDLDIGGTPVPAGTYSLWLLPTQGTTLLIVNKETKQWGTLYHAEQDLARIPMETRMGPYSRDSRDHQSTVDERFTLSLVGATLMVRWDNGGYDVKVSAR